MNLDGISSAQGEIPAEIAHSSDDPQAGEHDILFVDGARFQPVPPAVWRYDVGGMPVVRHWFGYRKRQPEGRITSDLDRILPDRSRDDTRELRELLSVLRRLVDLAPSQAALLGNVSDGPLITVEDLTQAGVLPVPDSKRRLAALPTSPDQDQLM